MESLASEDVTADAAEALATVRPRPPRLVVGFQFDNLRRRDKRPGTPGPTIAVPAYSRIVYRAGSVSIR